MKKTKSIYITLVKNIYTCNSYLLNYMEKVMNQIFLT